MMGYIDCYLEQDRYKELPQQLTYISVLPSLMVSYPITCSADKHGLNTQSFIRCIALLEVLRNRRTD